MRCSHTRSVEKRSAAFRVKARSNLIYWLFGLCRPPGIVKNTFWELDQFQSSSRRVGGSYVLSWVRQKVITCITGLVSETLCSLECWTMDKVQKPSNPECYPPSSETFRFDLTVHFAIASTLNQSNQVCCYLPQITFNSPSTLIFPLVFPVSSL
jgi:hypothetical protein